MTPPKRQYPRKEVRIEVSLSVSSMLQKFHSKNLSEGGIFLVVEGAPPRMGETIEMVFSIPGRASEIEVSGKVIYLHGFEDIDSQTAELNIVKGVGIQFINLSEENRALIQEFVEGKQIHVQS